MSDEKIIITADEAISLLKPGDTVHNFANPAGGLFIGIDYDRADAEEHIRDAVSREIGGAGCKGMGHALVVHSSETRYTFFETDMKKVEAMERNKIKARE